VKARTGQPDPAPLEGPAAEARARRGTPNLKELARHLGLSPATVSLVLNRSPAAGSIPPETQERVFAGARELGYRPNYLARSLRSRRSDSIGVLVPEISDPYAAEVVAGIESHLLPAGYHYLVTSHRRSDASLLVHDLEMLEHRAVDGLILVATQFHQPLNLPAVAVSGHTEVEGIANVVVDHDRAAHLALSHLKELGHRRIAFFKGQPTSADTEERWRAVVEATAGLGLELRPELALQLSGDGSAEVFSPDDAFQEGYAFGRELLATGSPFTALFAFDDASAIGATRAFLDAGLRVPQDVSIVGFDDIQSAAFHNPRLTTVRQPLREMGRVAARILLQRLAGDEPDGGSLVVMEPQLIIRESTGPVAVVAVAPRRGGVDALS
jgi:LacI family transcriptional regulator